MIAVDFVTKDGRRILLHARLSEQPGQRFSAEHAELICTELFNFKKSLQLKLREAGCDVVLTTQFDTYASSLFWYLLLHRPTRFAVDNCLFGGRDWSVQEIIQDPLRAGELKKIDLGVMHDRTYNWLVILWDEAQKSGILAGWDNCPSWRWLKRRLHRLRRFGGSITDAELQRKLACESSWTVSPKQLKKMGYKERKLWFVPELQYKDITVLDLAALPALKHAIVDNGQEETRIRLPEPAFGRYSRFYTDDRKEYNKMRREFRMARRRISGMTPEELESQAQKNALRKYRRKAMKTRRTSKPGRVINYEAVEATMLINRIVSAYGVKLLRRGRPRLELTGKESDRLLMEMLEAYTAGRVTLASIHRTPANIEETAGKAIKLLETYLQGKVNSGLPKEYWKWVSMDHFTISQVANSPELVGLENV